jgi:hypothetical protein
MTSSDNQIPVTTSGRIHPYHPNMRPRFVLHNPIGLFFLLTACELFAQDASILRNTGEPIRVPFACSEEDLAWAGVSCSEDDPCPIYLELNAIAPNGQKIFVSGNLHSTSATLNSALLASDDGGSTWKEPTARIRGTAIDQLQFYDLEHGWAAGEIQYPLPRDPFFLLTTDGGQSWRQRAVSEEGTPGTVQRFWFDSARHGQLILDGGKSASTGRFTSWETETGGESWSIRATTDRLPVIRNAPPSQENPDWRIRSSKDGKSWQIEKRMGENWSQISSFLVEVASCKPKTVDLKEPEIPSDTPPEQPAVAPGKTPARKSKPGSKR